MIHSSEKKVVIATISLALLFMAALVYAMVKKNVDIVDCVPFDKSYLEPGVHQISDKYYKINAVGSMWKFEPQQITVPAGSDVEFFITSKDVAHGFNITHKNVNVMALYGQVTTYKVKFEQPGSYQIICNEYCGVAHQNMVGELVVK